MGFIKMTNLLRIILLLSAMIIGGQLAYAKSIPSQEELSAQTTQIIDEMKNLKDGVPLTADQASKMREILESNVEKTHTAMQAHGIKPDTELSIGQEISLAHDLRPMRKESDKKLEAILSPDQMKAFKKIRTEIRDKMN